MNQLGPASDDSYPRQRNDSSRMHSGYASSSR
jgi:hypothetical protein